MITDANFDVSILAATGATVVMMWRPGCPACEMLTPTLISVAKQLPDVRFVMMNSFDNPITRDDYGVHQCPALLLFRNGQMIAKTFGAAPAGIIAQWITTEGKSETPLAAPCHFCMAVRRKIKEYLPRFLLRWIGAAHA